MGRKANKADWLAKAVDLLWAKETEKLPLGLLNV